MVSLKAHNQQKWTLQIVLTYLSVAIHQLTVEQGSPERRAGNEKGGAGWGGVEPRQGSDLGKNHKTHSQSSESGSKVTAANLINSRILSAGKFQ